MKIRAALAADLGILTAALDESDADMLQNLHQLGVNAQAALSTYLGLSVTVDGGDDPPFTFTTLDDGAADDVRASLRLTLPGVGAGRAAPMVALLLYAGTPGAFVDLAADLAWLTGRPLDDFALDQHLSVPGKPDTGTYLGTASVINQAIGVLIGRGCTPGQAHRELDIQADGGADRHTAAQFILETLTAADPADDERTDQEPNIS
ncbi:hypothetical protein [Mycobacterium sp.]|uniref:hypothetical protein n=1 Tax=Mycobacterium sp. TaxID=1785 RepID=UPI002B8A5BE0|nr:hypothetical protein [Mycobacterium sp.]HTQ19369.1 hypothetical protein [Mycobacterium sp.]